MAQQIFTRPALNKILGNENLTAEERAEQIYSMFGRALDEGYVSRDAAQQARDKALNDAKAEWEKAHQTPDPKESDDYRKLSQEFTDYRTMQEARGSKDYEGVKPKFFETVYGMVKRGDGAEPVDKQLAAIRENYEEYFTATPAQQQKPPVFGAPTEGSMPKGNEGAANGFAAAWGFGPKKT